MRKLTPLTVLASLLLVSSCGDVISSAPAPPPPPAIVISPNVAPSGTVGFGYSLTLAATGGQAPYTWSVIAGALPASLSLNASTGLVSGVPTASGTSNFTVQAADSSVPARTGGMPFSLVVNPQLSFSITSLPDAAVGIAYDAIASVSGGLAPYTWSISSGSLPPGLSLNSSTGSITGTPTVAGSFGLGLKVTDSSAPQQTAKFFSGINVYPQLMITSTSLPDGAVGSPYNATLTASGGTGSYTWSIASGAPPDGISLDATTGILSGTPTSAGQANFTVQVTDTANPPQTPTLPLSLSVEAEGANNRLMRGSYAFLLQGFDSNGAVAIAGNMDADGAGSITGGVLDINRSTGALENVPIASGKFAINSDDRGTITIQSALGRQTFQVAINAAGTLAHFIEFDSAGPRVVRGNGIMKRRDAAIGSRSAWSGNHAFSFSGSTLTGRRSALIGSFTANSAGGISAGLADSNSDGAVIQSAAIDEASNYSLASNGRGALNLVVDGLGSISGAIYLVSASECFFVRTDAPGTDLLSGEIVRQSGSPFPTLAFTGPRVLHLEGESVAGSTVIGAGLVVSESPFALSGTYDRNDGGRVTSKSVSDGSFEMTSADFGRGRMKFAGNDVVFYLVDSETALVMDAEGREVKTGMLEGQSAGAPSFRLPAGEFAEGTESNTSPGVAFESGVLSIEPADSFSETTDMNLAGYVLTSAYVPKGILSFAAAGRFTASDGTIYYVVSPTRIIEVDMQSNQSQPRLVIVDQ